MTDKDVSRTGLKDIITPKGYVFIALWALGTILLYAAGGFFGSKRLRGYRAETEQRRQTWIESATTEVGASVPDIETAPGRGPVDVVVGIRVNRIQDFSLDKATWTADFDIWFRWSGYSVSPGEHFQVLNGDIDFRERKEAFSEGINQYERYNVRARLAFNFDPGRFPLGDQVLNIQVEDAADTAERLRFIPDELDSSISPLGVPASVKVIRRLATTKLQVYQTRRGDPRLPEGQTDIHSRFIYAFVIAPPGSSLFAKLFQALFASVAIAFVVFFIKPIHVDPRFGLGVGAFFAAVSNNIYTRSFIPISNRICLTDMINVAGLLTIFLTLVQSTASLYIFDTLGREKMRRLFDHIAFGVFLVGYVSVNVVLILAARS